MMKHVNHPTYIFSAQVQRDVDESDANQNETHAMIFADDDVALTIHDSNYHLFNLNNGCCAQNQSLKLAKSSIEKIKQHRAKENAARYLDSISKPVSE